MGTFLKNKEHMFSFEMYDYIPVPMGCMNKAPYTLISGMPMLPPFLVIYLL
jgi:hypothetical protein